MWLEFFVADHKGIEIRAMQLVSGVGRDERRSLSSSSCLVLLHKAYGYLKHVNVTTDVT